MSDIGTALRDILIQDTDVAAVTQTIVSDHLPQGMSIPAVVFWAISSSAEDILNGPTGFEQATYQIDCMGTTRSESYDLWRKVNKALAGFRGVSQTVLIRSVAQSTGHYDREDRPEQGTDRYRFVTSQDLEVSYHPYEKAC